MKSEDILVKTSPGKIFVLTSHLIPMEDPRAGVKSPVLLTSSCPVPRG